MGFPFSLFGSGPPRNLAPVRHVFENFSVVVVTPPTGDVFGGDYTELKQFCKITTNYEDLSLVRMLKAATTEVERITNRSILPQQMAILFDRFPTNGVAYLYRPPVQSFVSFTIFDSTNTPHVVDSSEYFTLLTIDPGQIEINVSNPVQVPFSLGIRESRAYQLVYTTGYPTLEAIPDGIIMGIEVLTDFYFSRGQDPSPPRGLLRCLDPYRVPS